MIEKALSGLPETLDDTYVRILKNIPDTAHEVAFTLLRWIAYSERPLSLSELVDTNIITLDGDLDGTVHCEDRGQWDDALDLMAGLIVCDQSNSNASLQRVSLVHFSLQEYLESTRIRSSSVKSYGLCPERDHGYLAQSCLVYIKYNLESVFPDADSEHSEDPNLDYSDGPESDHSNDSDAEHCDDLLADHHSDDLNADHRDASDADHSAHTISVREDGWHNCLRMFPLLSYTLGSWPYHSNRQQRGTCKREVALLTSEKYIGRLHELHIVEKTSAREPWDDDNRPPTAIEYAVDYEVVDVVQILLAADKKLAEDWFLMNALCEIAVMGESVDVFKVLCDHRAGQTEWMSETARLAVQEENIEALQVLLQANDADLLCEANYEIAMVKSTTFNYYAKHRSKRMLEMLRVAGANMDARTGHPVHKILADVLLADLESLRLQLKEVVDPKEHGYAFLQAAERGGVATMKLLLEHNIGHESIPYSLRTACICRVHEGGRKLLNLQQENIQFLLEQGASDYFDGLDGLIHGSAVEMLSWLLHICMDDFDRAVASMFARG
jgi:hypothetical protein